MVHGQRARPRRINANPNHLPPRKPLLLVRNGKRPANRTLQTKHMVTGALARKIVVGRIQKNSLPPPRVIHRVRTIFPAVTHTHHKGADAVGSKINANGAAHGEITPLSGYMQDPNL